MSVNIIFKDHYMPIGKCIFAIFLSLFATRSFRGMGVGRRAEAATGFWNLTFSYHIFLKVFLVLSGENLIFPLLTSLQTYFGPPLENLLLTRPWKKILLALMFRGTCSSIEMLKGYTDRESLGTPVIIVS